MNHLLIILFITLLTSCGHEPKIDNTPDSNEQKDKIISDSAHTAIKKSDNDNPNDTISLTETFNIEFDTLNQKPRITNDKSIVSNLPAATYNGQYVIVNTDIYSCCFDDGNFLRLYDITGNEEVKPIQTFPAEDVEWDDATFDSVRIQVEDMINARNYYTMTAIHEDSSKVIKQNPGVDLSIEMIFNNKIYESKIFKIDSIEYGDSRCCLGFIKKDYNCKIFPRIMNISMDARERMILVEYGIIHGASSCDSGPFFKTVDLIEND